MYLIGGANLIKKRLNDIANMSNGKLYQEDKDIIIQGVSIDSRKITPGQLYIPIVGPRFDGHQFLDDAINNGAVATLWQQGVELPSSDIPLIIVEDTLKALQTLATSYRDQLSCKVIAITGSNGKTSTKDIIYQIFSQNHKTYKTQGNKNNEFGLPLTILECDEDIEYLILEMGMSALKEISFLSKLAKPNIAIITSIGKAHLTDLGSVEHIISAKLEIIEGLNPAGVLIVNGDHELLKTKISAMKIKQKLIYYGKQADNDYQITDVVDDISGIKFNLLSVSEEAFICPLIGNHQAYNVTAAILVAQYEGLSLTNIRKGLQTMDKIKDRLEMMPIDNGFILNDSYKSNPESLQAALLTLKNLPEKYIKIAVLADMKDLGNEAETCHMQIGDQLDPQVINYLYTMGDLSTLFNYKHQYDVEHYHHFSDKNSLASTLKNHLKEPSVILIKGANVYKLWELIDILKEKQ